MQYTEPKTAKSVSVYLFVSDLVSPLLAFIEPTLPMDDLNWLQCHVGMFTYYGGAPRLVVYDNLLTGVQRHAHEGAFIRIREYEQLEELFRPEIIPARVRNTKDNNSTGNTYTT